MLRLAEVEALLASNALVVDACRNAVRAGQDGFARGRPVLFALARALAEAWPGDVSRANLLARAFRATRGGRIASRPAARGDRAAAQVLGRWPD